jgi:hypothetical protein
VFKESRKPWQVLKDRWKLKKKNATKEYSPAVFRQCHEKAKKKWTRRNPGKEFGSDDDSKLFVDAMLYQASKEAENRVSEPLLLHHKKPTGMLLAQGVSSSTLVSNLSCFSIFGTRKVLIDGQTPVSIYPALGTLRHWNTFSNL